MFSAALMLAGCPSNAERHLQEGHQQAKKAKWNDAAASYRSAAISDPQNAHALALAPGLALPLVITNLSSENLIKRRFVKTPPGAAIVKETGMPAKYRGARMRLNCGRKQRFPFAEQCVGFTLRHLRQGLGRGMPSRFFGKSSRSTNPTERRNRADN